MEEEVINLQEFLDKKRNVQLIRDKLKEYRKDGVTDSFELEMKLMEELPEQYSEFPWLIKRLTKSEDETYLNKFLESLERVVSGDQSLASAELNLGMELKQQFIDPILNNQKEDKNNETHKNSKTKK